MLQRCAAGNVGTRAIAFSSTDAVEPLIPFVAIGRASRRNWSCPRARAVDVDAAGVAWVAFGTGAIGKFDRSKCKVTNGPSALGQHCPEGWEIIETSGPKLKGTDVGSDWFYLVERSGALGHEQRDSSVASGNRRRIVGAAGAVPAPSASTRRVMHADSKDFDAGAAIVRVDALRKFRELVTNLGGDARKLLAEAQIDADILNNRHAVIPYRSLVILLEAAACRRNRRTLSGCCC